jgi:hypothetical protein
LDIDIIDLQIELRNKIIMNLDQLIEHLEDIRETCGGHTPVLANDDLGDLVKFKKTAVYTVNPAMTGVKVIFDC